MSLEHCVTHLRSDHNLAITKQSLDERFNEGAVAFVKDILRQALEVELEHIFSNDLFQQFNYVRIKDSTKFNIDNRLEKQLKGSGGNGTRKACVCIQYEFDVKTGKILDLAITPGVINDAVNAKETQYNINQGDLIIRDLGYYNLDVLASFDSEGAFFVSRLNMSTSIFEHETGQQISFENLYKKMMKNGWYSIEMDVLVSKSRKKRCRLVVTILPEEEYQKRIRKANKSNKECGYSTSKDYKARARFNLFITNISSKIISMQEIMLLYRIRWQIELTFKTWKSVCGLDKLQPMKYCRFICLLMARLILIVLRLKLFWVVQKHFFSLENRILSMDKCFKTFQATYLILQTILKSDKKESKKNVWKYIKIFNKNHWKEKRKKRQNYEEIIGLFICESNNYDYISKEKERAA